MKFIDLFAGLGGFHQALDRLGHECVFASELDAGLQELYERNFGIRPHGDIREVPVSEIPEHDILCAGFPCQPFSKAGDQKGLECPQWGDLIDYVIQILKFKKPSYFLIENVPNLIKHNGGLTWSNILDRLQSVGYGVDYGKLSPHFFGVPQKRERAFIAGVLGGKPEIDWEGFRSEKKTDISSILEESPKQAHHLTDEHIRYLEVWQKFIADFPRDRALPSFPIWAMEFGADYPVDLGEILDLEKIEFSKFRGTFGSILSGSNEDEMLGKLPPYARSIKKGFPQWKQNFIRQNREFYCEHKKLIDPWISEIKDFPASFQKLEWNYKGGMRDIWQHVIQFRASGIRVKRRDTAPSLIAMTTSQVPIIAWKKRYMTVRECSRLQSMGGLKHLPDSKAGAYKAFGNAVNVEVVEKIARSLISGEFDETEFLAAE